jgi:hypothetical protein
MLPFLVTSAALADGPSPTPDTASIAWSSSHEPSLDVTVPSGEGGTVYVKFTVSIGHLFYRFETEPVWVDGSESSEVPLTVPSEAFLHPLASTG